MRRLALLLLLAATLAANPLRVALERPPALPPCTEPEGRGRPPRGWVGCSADPGPARPLSQEERLALGRPVDPNRAGARELALVPGLSRSLAAAVVEDRRRRGPFASVDDLLRVRGVGPGRLQAARPHLEVAAP